MLNPASPPLRGFLFVLLNIRTPLPPSLRAPPTGDTIQDMLINRKITGAILLCAATGLAADFDTANQALERGDYPKAEREFLILAEQGDVFAQYNLGVIYYTGGSGMPHNYREALKWFGRAAEQGYAEAQYNLGAMYNRGKGVKKDFARAYEWYLQAARQDHAAAQYSLGLLFARGQGVPRDTDAAVAWYKRAAARGHRGAQYNLGVIYGNGIEVEQNMIEAYMWFSIAGAAGDRESRDHRATLAKYMTPVEIADAEKRAKAWTSEHTQ